MQTFSHRGLPVAYCRSGTGTPAVFLHNGGTSHAIWRPVLDRLAGCCDAHAVDLPGFGASANPGPRYTVDAYVDMVGALIDGRGLGPVALVGNCMGSAIALSFARARPRDVAALVLINPLTEQTAAPTMLGVTTRALRSGPRSLSWAAAALSRLRIPKPIARRAVRYQLGRGTDARGVPELRELDRGLAGRGQLDSLLAVVDDIDSYAALDTFAPPPEFPPICTIWGLDNRVLSPMAGRHLNAKLSPARSVWLDGCGHLPMLEQPDLVASAIHSFLSEVQQ